VGSAFRQFALWFKARFHRLFGAVYDDDPGHPPLPTRLLAGLAILKASHNPPTKVPCERWWGGE
jgi:hypothetical protein